MPKNIPKWPLQETINQYELSHNSPNVFSRANKTIIFGRAITDLILHHSVKNESFFSVTLEVERSDSSVDHIPVLISKSLIKKKDLPLALTGTWLEIAGQFRSYDLIVDGARKHPLFVFAKAVSVFTRESRIQRRIGKNAIFLDGYVAEYPILRFVCDNTDVAEFILAVPGRYQNLHLIPCTLYGKYARFASKMKYGDFITLYGQIQSNMYSPYRIHPIPDYNTEYEVSVVDILAAPMFRRARS